MPPSRDQQPARRRGPSPATVAAAGPAPIAAPSAEPAAPRGSLRAPGRQPYLPFSVEGSGSLADAASTFQRLVTRVVQPRKEKVEGDRRARQPGTPTLLPASSSGDALATLGGGEANGSSSVAAAANTNGAAGASANDGQAAVRRVAFETTVLLEDGGTVPLRTESANDRSHFVRGVGPVERRMDALKQYQVGRAGSWVACMQWLGARLWGARPAIPTQAQPLDLL